MMAPEDIKAPAAHNAAEAAYKTTIVVPSLPGLAYATLLMLLSIIRFIKGDRFNIALIGKEKFDEDWLKDALQRNMVNQLVCEIPFDWEKNYKADIPEALKMAVADENVCDDFIFWPPGTFLIQNVSLHHLMVPKHCGLLSNYNHTGDAFLDGAYALLSDLLPHNAKYNFDSGAPLAMSKELVVDIMGHTDGKEADFLTVYGNGCPDFPIFLDWQRDEWLLPVISQKPSEEGFAKYVANKCMIACRNHGPLPDIVKLYVESVI